MDLCEGTSCLLFLLKEEFVEEQVLLVLYKQFVVVKLKDLPNQKTQWDRKGE